MPDLWKMKRLRNGNLALVPLHPRLGEQCMKIAQLIPGAQADIDGTVEGGWTALCACLRAAGQPVKWLGFPGTDAAVLASSMTQADCLPDYQHSGVKRMLRRLEMGVINNDDVGLGKTVQTIATLCQVDRRDRKIILCPAFLKSQWVSELHTWVPRLRGDQPSVAALWPKSDRRSRQVIPSDAEWIVAFYLDSDKALELAEGYNYWLVTDEIHNIRSMGAKRMENAKQLSTFAAGRIGLTASLLYNDAARLYPILNLVSPGEWGSYWAFATRYASATEGEYGLVTGKLSNVAELNLRKGVHSFRRTREEVADQLPFDTVYQTLWLDPPPGNKLSLRGATNVNPIGMMDHLRAVAEYKAPLVAEQVKSDGQPAIVFTWLRSQATEISRLIPGSYLVLGGAGSATRLARIGDYVARCRAKGVDPVVVGTIDALGEGANLQWAKVVNIAALDYTPDRIKQAVGRAARMGQTGTVSVRVYACRYTMDEHCIQILLAKLSEQFKLDGRKEADKSKLNDALTRVSPHDVAAEIYARFMAEEKAA